MATAWHLVPEKYADSAMTGIGGLYASGRWHSQGKPIVYAASSQALAMLEVLVHLDRSYAPDRMSLFEIEFDAKLLKKLSRAKLPKDWRNTPAPAALQKIGDEWLIKSQSPVYDVPSSLVLDECNYLLNPQHQDFSLVNLKKVHPVSMDHRLLQ